MTNSVFFKDGILTSTSANYLAELAKERVRILEKKISDLQFYKEYIQLLGTPNKSIISLGHYPYDIENIVEIISQYKSFIAWIREALKTKAELVKDLNDYDINMWAIDNNIILPTCPKKRKPLTEEEYYNSLSIKERMEYYNLETICSQLGKTIHENGYLSKARIKLAEVINNPTTISGTGRDAIIYIKEPIVEQKEVDAIYFNLQTKHREHQARLNAIKHKCELAIEESQTSCLNEFNSQYEAYKKGMTSYENQYNSWLVEEGAKVRNLKIAIPNALQSIYQELNSITKD